LVGVLVVQAVMDKRRAEELAAAFPAHLMSSESRLKFKAFVDGLSEAVDTGKLAAGSTAALRAAQEGMQTVAKLDPDSSLSQLNQQLASLTQMAAGPTAMKDLVAQAALIGQANQQFGQIDDAYRARMQAVIDKAGAEARQQVWLALGATAMIVLLASYFVRGMIRTLTAPLREAIERAQAIARGRLQALPEVSGSDETSQLLQALSAMTSALRSVVGKVRQSSDGITLASNAVADGSGALSERTQAAQASLAQTVGSVAQLLSTIHQNAADAQKANGLAVSASSVADCGGKVVGEVASTMRDIAAHSRRIGDIIGVIDGIAFQTNILALNAAVEAARAGEQGRGFAVVAAEVRALAKRSAEAAKEIKQLIGSSIERVESGSRQAAQAGSTMQDIVTQVRDVTDLIERINRASSSQAVEIERLNVTVQSLERMTQQNALLVEQSGESSEALKRQGVSLADAVSVFRDDGG